MEIEKVHNLRTGGLWPLPVGLPASPLVFLPRVLGPIGPTSGDRRVDWGLIDEICGVCKPQVDGVKGVNGVELPALNAAERGRKVCEAEVFAGGEIIVRGVPFCSIVKRDTNLGGDGEPSGGIIGNLRIGVDAVGKALLRGEGDLG